MKKLLLIFSTLGINLIANAGDLSGIYKCSGFDSKDGTTSNLLVKLDLDKTHSDIKHDFYSYGFSLTQNGNLVYKGAAVSSGQILSISFDNIKNKTDHGVGLANVHYDFDKNGNITTTKFTKYYYEPEYTSHGIETCIKQ